MYFGGLIPLKMGHLKNFGGLRLENPGRYWQVMKISTLMPKSGEDFGTIIPAMGHLMSLAHRETNGFGVPLPRDFWDLDWHTRGWESRLERLPAKCKQGDIRLKHWPGCETMAPRVPETGVSPPSPQFHWCCWAAMPTAAAGDGTGIPPAVPL